MRRSCDCKPLDWLKFLSHTEHWYGFSLVWVLLCIVSHPASVNRLPQTEHWNGFSPEWIRLCIVKSRLSRQLCPHTLHVYLQQWIFICRCRYLCVENHFLHSVHEYILSLCVSLCLFSARLVAKSFSQFLHTCGLELLSHAGSDVGVSFSVSCEISPAKKCWTLVYLQILSDCVMRHRTNCRGRTTNSSVTVQWTTHLHKVMQPTISLNLASQKYETYKANWFLGKTVMLYRKLLWTVIHRELQ